MNPIKSGASTLVLLFASSAANAAFPHKSAIYTTTMSGPMMEITSDYYVSFDANKGTSAEWTTQKSPVGETRTLNITTDGIVHHVDLKKRQCTKTNVRAITGNISNPEALAASIKQQMNLKKAGSCEGAGYKGVKYTSPFGEMCLYHDVFMLWQSAMGTRTQVTKLKFDVSLPKDKITVPAGLDCKEGPDLSRGWQDVDPSELGSSTSSADEAASSNRQPPPQDAEEAMKRAEDMMKSIGDMFK